MPGTQAPIERRKFPRVSVQFRARYRLLGDGPTVKAREDRMITLSEGGGFIQTKQTYAKGTQIEVSFELDGADLQAEASVRHSVPYSPSGGPVQFPGMGFQFEKLAEDAAKRIREFVAKEKFKGELE